MAELVSIGVPVYRGGNFIAESLTSIAKQTHQELDVLISVDGADEVSTDACRPFLEDGRFRIVVQDHQLGWAQNISLLMRECRGEFWYYHQQDDFVAPEYVEALLDHARGSPLAAVVYSDMEGFGDLAIRMAQPPVTGTAAVRELVLLESHHPAVAFRGLTRRGALAQTGGIRENKVDNFSADTTWMASVARAGELHRVPRILYFKRYHRDNVHTKWTAWPLERRKLAWQVHCRDMFLEAVRAASNVQERRLMWSVTVGRLVSNVAAGYLPVATFNGANKTAMLQGFLRRAAEHEREIETFLETPWSRITTSSRLIFEKASQSTNANSRFSPRQ